MKEKGKWINVSHLKSFPCTCSSHLGKILQTPLKTRLVFRTWAINFTGNYFPLSPQLLKLGTFTINLDKVQVQHMTFKLTICTSTYFKSFIHWKTWQHLCSSRNFNNKLCTNLTSLLLHLQFLLWLLIYLYQTLT